MTVRRVFEGRFSASRLQFGYPNLSLHAAIEIFQRLTCLTTEHKKHAITFRRFGFQLGEARFCTSILAL